ncbi:sodium/hydrogen exchanger 9B2-like isoform X2 [Mytilus trossulus]
MLKETDTTDNMNGVILEEDTEETEQESTRKCHGCRAFCHNLCMPCRTKYHPLPENPNCWDRFKFTFMCPPHGVIARYFRFLFLCGITFGVLLALFKDYALPGGNFFSLYVLFFGSVLGGYLISFIKLPPLLGMLLVGALLRNVPVIDVVGNHLDPNWSGALRQIALTVILIRAGLGLDPVALGKLSFTVVRLACSPCLVECIAEAIASHFLLGLPWEWAFMLGFVLSAVSPAVVVPSLLNLSDRGYGINKGIPTLVIAAASIDDVLAITGFGVVLGMAFSTGDIAVSIIKGPAEALLGVAYGVIGGIVLWYIPAKGENFIFYRGMTLLGAGLLATFGSAAIELSGAGPLGVLTIAFVAAFRWRKEKKENDQDPIKDIVAILWMLFQPILFGLIGAEVQISKIDGQTVGLGIATLSIGMVVRLVVSFLAVFKSGLNFKEMLFIPFAWFPKATVQAAIGGVALDAARRKGDATLEAYGEIILTMAVLSIIITAPIGAIAIAITGPRLLKRTVKDKEYNEEDVQDTDEKAEITKV